MIHIKRMLTGMLFLGVVVVFLYLFVNFTFILLMIIGLFILLVASYVIGYEILK